MIKNRRIRDLTDGRSWCWLALLPAAILTALAVFGTLGNAQDLDHRRVFDALDPVVDFIRVDCGRLVHWLSDHAFAVGGFVFGVSVLVYLTGAAFSRKLRSPMLLVCAGVGFVGSGQSLIVEERFLLGTCLYGCGAACAFWLGRVCPMVRLPGFPRCGGSGEDECTAAADGPAVADDVSTAHASALPSAPAGGLPTTISAAIRSTCSKATACRFECLVVGLLSILGLILRFYGLNELPSGFDSEMIDSMLQARTLHGVRSFLGETFPVSSVGFAHIPIQFVSERVFGASYLSIRVASVFWGTVTIPLFYWLLRRIGGVVPAILGTLLFITAPEQLFWSRSEDGHFAAMEFYAVVSGHLALWLACRRSWASALVSGLWIPVATFFYFPSMSLVGLPALAWVHRVLFTRRGWRSARYVVPLLAAGVVMLVFAKSTAISAAGDHGWRFHSPLVVHGGAAWKGAVPGGDISVRDIARRSIENVTTNLPQVFRGLAYSNAASTHWTQRDTFGAQPGPSINVAVTALLALGIGFLAGQPRDSRTAVLLLWIALGLAPGILSDEPAPRRIGMIFPAILAVATIQLAVISRVTRVVAGQRLARPVRVLCLLLAAVIAWTNLVSHFRLPTGPVVFAEFREFVRPEMEASDTVYHTFEGRFGKAVFLSFLDRLVEEHRPCIAQLDEQSRPRAAVFPECRFDGFENFYDDLFSPEALAEIRMAYVPSSFSFIVHDRFGASPLLEALAALYPEAVANARHLRAGDFGDLYAVRVPASAMAEKRRPLLTTVGDDEPGGSLTGGNRPGVREGRSPPLESEVYPSSRTRLQGGLLIPHDDWYRFEIVPAEAGVELLIDGRPVSSIDQQPLLAGAHAIEAEFSGNRATPPPFEIEAIGARTGSTRFSSETDLVHPAVAAAPGLRAPKVAVFDGYTDFRQIAAIPDRPVDLGVDGTGRLYVLSWGGREYTVTRISPDGSVEATWRPPVRNDDQASMAVDTTGRVVLVGRNELLLFDADGRPLNQAPLGFGEAASDVAFLNDGRILLAVDDRHSLEVFDAAGHHLDSLTSFGGDTDRISKPLGLAVGPDQGILVVEFSGRALLFRAADGAWPPLHERTFATGLQSPLVSRGSAFDGRQRIIIPDRGIGTLRLFDSAGRRMMAREPAHDLSRQPIRSPTAFARHSNTLYVLDDESRRLVAVDIVMPSP